jgi:hypothetical protein
MQRAVRNRFALIVAMNDPADPTAPQPTAYPHCYMLSI